MAKAYDFDSKSRRSPNNLYRLPSQGSEYNLFKQAFSNICDPESPGRIELMRETELGRAMYLSKQWLTLNVAERDQTRAIRFTEQDPTKKIPRPVNNEILPIVDNEASKLYRRKSTAYVRPVAVQEGSSGRHTGAAKATDILDWQLENLNWSRARRTAVFRGVLYGTAFFWSYLDQSYLDSVKVGLTNARRCYTGCDLVLASTDLPASQYEQNFGYDAKRVHRSTEIGTDGSVSYAYEAKTCPKCGGPLTEFVVTDDTLMEEGDFFDRPLYDKHPKNQPMLELPEPWEIYVDNEGIGHESNDPTKVKKWFRVSPRSMDYLEEHYPWASGKLERDDARKISDYYPVLGEYAFGSAGGLNVERRNVWRDHALEFSAIEEPCLKYPEGRYVVVAGGMVLRDEALYRKSKRDPENLKVPLVQVTASRFFIKDGEIHGQGLVRGLLSPQNRLNMAYSQVTDSRQRNGVDAVLATDGTRLTSGWVDGYNGRVLRFTPDPAHPNILPQHVPSRMIDASIYQEIDRILQHMRSFAGSTDADRGEAPRNVSAATAIQMLQEAVQGRREGREQELIDCFREIFSHQLLLLAEFAVEPRSFRRKTQSGQWEYLEFTGLDLAGHTDVILEEQAGYDARAFEREALLQGIQAQIIIAQSPYARREAAKVMGISMKILDEENVQISDCEAKYYAFRNHQIVPKIDPDLDDHSLMYSVYGRFLKTAEGMEMAETAGWAEVLPLIAGWDKRLSQARALSERVKLLQSQAQGTPRPPMQAIPGVPPPPPDPVIMAQTTLYQMEVSGKPPELAILPESVVDQILIIWAKDGVDISQPFTQMMAVVRAHMLLAEGKKAQAMVGPRLAAPGGQRTPIGTEPVSGSQPVPGSGDGTSPDPAIPN